MDLNTIQKCIQSNSPTQGNGDVVAWYYFSVCDSVLATGKAEDGQTRGKGGMWLVYCVVNGP